MIHYNSCGGTTPHGEHEWYDPALRQQCPGVPVPSPEPRCLLVVEEPPPNHFLDAHDRATVDQYAEPPAEVREDPDAH